MIMIAHLAAFAVAIRDVFREASLLRRQMRRRHGFIPE
jgi:hypothetical protein